MRLYGVRQGRKRRVKRKLASPVVSSVGASSSFLRFELKFALYRDPYAQWTIIRYGGDPKPTIEAGDRGGGGESARLLAPVRLIISFIPLFRFSKAYTLF